jgi:Sigma-70, region 4
MSNHQGLKHRGRPTLNTTTEKPRGLGANKQRGTALYSLSEIGAACGVTMQTIQQIEQRALRKIKVAIEQESRAAGVSVSEWLFGADTADEITMRNVLRQILRELGDVEGRP